MRRRLWRRGALASEAVTISDHERRLHDLFTATIALNAELSLDTLLQKLVETAAELTDAQLRGVRA